MDNRLVLGIKTKTKINKNVIILVVVDNGLVLAFTLMATDPTDES